MAAGTLLVIDVQRGLAAEAGDRCNPDAAAVVQSVHLASPDGAFCTLTDTRDVVGDLAA